MLERSRANEIIDNRILEEYDKKLGKRGRIRSTEGWGNYVSGPFANNLASEMGLRVKFDVTSEALGLVHPGYLKKDPYHLAVKEKIHGHRMSYKDYLNSLIDNAQKAKDSGMTVIVFSQFNLLDHTKSIVGDVDYMIPTRKGHGIVDPLRLGCKDRDLAKYMEYCGLKDLRVDGEIWPGCVNGVKTKLSNFINVTPGIVYPPSNV